MNNNKVNIGVAIAIGLISCITNIFSKELHDWLSSFSSVNLAWVIPIFNLLLITGFVWWLLRVFTFRKLQEYQSSSTISPELNELKSTITKLGERVSNEVNFQQRNLIEVEDSKQRKFCMDESKRMNDKIQEQGSTISELRNQLTQHKTWLEELKENSYTAKDRFEMEVLQFVIKQRSFMLYNTAHTGTLNYGNGERPKNIGDCYRWEQNKLHTIFKNRDFLC